MIDFKVALFNEFILREPHRDKLLSYYVLHWRLDYLIRKLNDDGTLTHDGVTFTPIWLDRMTTPMGQVKLSFRRLGYDTMNVVLIKAK